MIIFSEFTDSGFLKLSTIWKGEYYSRMYQGYKIKEAKDLFRNYIRIESLKEFCSSH